ncbi:substrate-binding protein [Mesorhizobium sp. LCM 4577]|uniref:substrate-binding protein n=1 Tax=Mesorhizobium sp. LCM 4577 TaxID=1848288 RepID=UPI0009F2296D|nr:substrate-binding protein [Mesorhizobium sp. LCM 4577]
MHLNSRISRRKVLFTGAAGALAGLAMPYVARAAGDPIKVGILQPFSGGLEVLGQQGFQGAEMALLEANEAGGVLGGRMFEIVKADDRTDPKTAVERTSELIRRDKVTAIIGPVTSANRDAMLPTIERYKTPLLYATDYEGGVCSRYVTCYSALPAHWVNPLVPYAVENLGKAFYLVGSDYVWPQKMNKAFREEVEKVKAKVVGEEYTPWGAKDYAATLRKIESAGADVVVITIVGADAVTFVKQFAAAGLQSKIKIIFFGFNENYVAGLSETESNGIVAPSNFIANLDKPEAKAFVQRFHTRYGANAVVSNTTDAHYTLTRFFIEGVKKAGADDKEKILAAMVGQSLMSGNGEVDLRASDRHADLNVLIVQVDNGQLKVLKDLGRIVAPSQCG